MLIGGKKLKLDMPLLPKSIFANMEPICFFGYPVPNQVGNRNRYGKHFVGANALTGQFRIEPLLNLLFVQ